MEPDELIVGAVPASMVELIWDKVEPLLEMVVQKTPEDLESEVVKERLQRGEQLLVTISRGQEVIAINVLDVRTLDTCLKVLYIPITAGTEMEAWIDKFLELATAVARDYNCVELRGIAVRDGWLRKLKQYGWEPLHTTIRCKLGE